MENQNRGDIYMELWIPTARGGEPSVKSILELVSLIKYTFGYLK